MAEFKYNNLKFSNRSIKYKDLFTRAGGFKKIYVKHLIKLSAKDINKIYKKYIKEDNHTTTLFLNKLIIFMEENNIYNPKNWNFIYDEEQGKFYNRKWLISRTNFNVSRIDETGAMMRKIHVGDQYNNSMVNNISNFINNDINEIVLDISLFGLDNLKNFLETLQDDDYLYWIYLGSNELYYTLSRDFIGRLISIITSRGEDGDGSDAVFYEYINSDNAIMNITRVEDGFTENREGGFFNYYNLTEINLEKYGIFSNPHKRHTSVNLDKYFKDNCLFWALKAGGMSAEKLNQVKTYVIRREVSLNKLGVLCKNLDIKIIMKYQRNTGKDIRKNTYGTNDKEVYNLGYVDGHIFLNDSINCSAYYIKNYSKLRDKKNGKFIYKCGRKRSFLDKNIKTEAFNIIRALLNNKAECLEKININELLKYDFKKNLDLHEIDLYNVDDDYQCLDSKKVKKDKYDEYDKPVYLYGDFETYFNESTEFKHKPYLFCVCDDNGGVLSFEGADCFNQWVDKIDSYKSNNIIIYFHNLKYDINVLLQNANIYGLKNVVIKDNNVYTLSTSVYKNKKVYNVKFIDSYKIIPMALSSFCKSFKLEYKKEVLPYGAYNKYMEMNDFKGSINRYRSMCLFLDYVKEEEKNDFINNCYKWGCVKPDHIDAYNIKNVEDLKAFVKDEYKKEFIFIDIIKYSLEYCKFDVLTLMKGLNAFYDSLKEIKCFSNLKINPRKYLTISSMADDIFKKADCYSGCCEVKGMARLFIEKSAVGGRVLTKNNKKISKITSGLLEIEKARRSTFMNKTDMNKTDINKMDMNVINDFDAVSLYPSAIYRLFKEKGGFLKGRPKILKENQLNRNFLNQVDGAFIEIKILNVPKKYNFSLLNYRNEEGVRVFTNDLINKNIVVDKITLEDIEKFHKMVYNIDYKIIRGIYFNEGRNANCKIIKELFEERKKLKQEGNPAQIVLKLLMNSSYGKTLLKCDNTTIDVFDDNKLKKYRSFNYNRIRSVKKINSKFWIGEKYKSIEEHLNRTHIGAEILSMSKRIMNEVMCLSQDDDYEKELDILYQDTDSIHINDEDIKELQKRFKTKYKKELIGDNLGQFHSDFEMKGCKDVVSIGFIGLGKKCYIDVLKGVDNNNNVKLDYHIRMKGVNCECIKIKAKSLGLTPLELYKKLYEGWAVEFNLLLGKPSFKANNILGGMESRTSFNRIIYFGDKSRKQLEEQGLIL